MNEKSNKVKFGISNLHIAKLNESEDGTITYGTPFKLPGAVSLTSDPEGDTNPFKADNITFYTSTTNNGYSGDLEVAMINDDFRQQILGQIKDSMGVLFESSDDVNSRFAMMCEIEGDIKKRRVLYYDCKANRPSTEAKTVEDNIEPNTDSIAITMNPRTTDRLVKCVIEPSEENKEIYEKFFESVYERTV